MSRDEMRNERDERDERDRRCDGEIDMIWLILSCHVWVAWHSHSHLYL